MYTAGASKEIALVAGIIFAVRIGKSAILLKTFRNLVPFLVHPSGGELTSRMFTFTLQFLIGPEYVRR